MWFGVKILDHYNHAREKHPYFADMWTHGDNNHFKMVSKYLKECILKRAKSGDVSARIVLNAEIAEVFEALTRGDLVQAREEIFDVIAVLMRMIDVIDGCAKFGDPQKAKVTE